LTGCVLAASPANSKASHCSQSAESDCCLPLNGSEEESAAVTVGFPTAAQSLSCCSLEALSSDLKRDHQGGYAATTIPLSSWITYSPHRKLATETPDRWARLPDRGGTFLIHCVFLI